MFHQSVVLVEIYWSFVYNVIAILYIYYNDHLMNLNDNFKV